VLVVVDACALDDHDPALERLPKAPPSQATVADKTRATLPGRGGPGSEGYRYSRLAPVARLHSPQKLRIAASLGAGKSATSSTVEASK
jgi:hypothetical protein